jgi:hypothetical protein
VDGVGAERAALKHTYTKDRDHREPKDTA